jgi:hypothetical protein
LETGDFEINFESAIAMNTTTDFIVFYFPNFVTETGGDVKTEITQTGNVMTMNFERRKGHYIIRLTNRMTFRFNFMVLMPRAGMSELRNGHATVSKN